MTGEALFIFVNVLFALINVGAYYASKVYAHTADKARTDVIEQRADLEKETAAFKEIVAENQKILDENYKVLRQIEGQYGEPRAPQIMIFGVNRPVNTTKEWIEGQRELFAKMSYDDFADWLDKGTVEDLMDAAPYFEMANLPRHAEILRGYLKNKGKVE